jgi:putative transposase
MRLSNASTLIRRQCRFGHIVRPEFSFAGEVQQVGQLQASPVDPTFNGYVANFLFRGFGYSSLGSGAENAVFKGRQFDKSVNLLCIRWDLTYNLSLRNLEEMMAERGISVDHATIHRWVVRYSPELLERFNLRKRSVSRKWHVDETYIKVRGQWKYLY